MQVCVSFCVHPLIAAAAINTSIPAGDSQRQSLRTVSSWRSNKAVVTARTAVFNRGGRAADGDGEVQGTRSENGSLARIRDGEQPPGPAVINLELGDPTMYEAFWKEAGECTAVVIPGWRGMSYFSDAGGLCPFLEPAFEREVRRLHRLVGNAAVHGYHLVVGTGATQLSQAAMYALSPADSNQHPIGVVSPAPYYSAYVPQTDLLLSGLYRWAGDANALGGHDSHIEIVCSPNNPDGAIRKAVLPGKAIHDLVYYWPQYTPITGRAAHDIMLFTMSKITGHAGTRLGWALVKDLEVAKKMVYFVDRSTIGVSRDSQLRAAKILALVSDAYDDDNDKDDTRRRRLDLFDFAQRRMADRWRALRMAVASTGTFSLPEETSGYCTFTKQIMAANPAFAWLCCEREGVENCGELLRGHGVVVQGGERFGGDARCVRVNMLDRDGVFDLLIQRLSSAVAEPGPRQPGPWPGRRKKCYLPSRKKKKIGPGRSPDLASSRTYHQRPDHDQLLLASSTHATCTPPRPRGHAGTPDPAPPRPRRPAPPRHGGPCLLPLMMACPAPLPASPLMFSNLN